MTHCVSKGRIRAKIRRVRAKRIVSTKRSVADTMVQIISSTSMQETPIVRVAIVKEQLDIMSTTG